MSRQPSRPPQPSSVRSAPPPRSTIASERSVTVGATGASRPIVTTAGEEKKPTLVQAQRVPSALHKQRARVVAEKALWADLGQVWDAWAESDDPTQHVMCAESAHMGRVCGRTVVASTEFA